MLSGYMFDQLFTEAVMRPYAALKVYTAAKVVLPYLEQAASGFLAICF